MKKTIHNLLREWGTRQRMLPDRHTDMKTQALERLRPVIEPMRPPLFSRVPWLATAFVGLAAIAFVLPNTSFRTSSVASRASIDLAPASTMNNENADAFMGTPPTAPTTEPYGVAGAASKQSVRSMAILPYPYPSPYPSPQVPAEDTRELLKTYYNTNLVTRSVDMIARNIQTMVRGYGGRIDNASIGEHFASISFVLPAAKFDTFRREMLTLLPKRFITEQTSVSNMLPQKRSLEERATQVATTLVELRAKTEQMATTHRQALAAIERRRAAIAAERTKLAAEIPIDYVGEAILKEQHIERRRKLDQEEARVNRDRANENARYEREKANNDAAIRYAEQEQTQVATQDHALLDDVATVEGSISISWVSVWGIAKLYLPTSWLAWVLLGAAVIALLAHRRKRESFMLP